MDLNKIIRAWTDPQYRESLTSEEQELLKHPAGFTLLSDEELKGIAGGSGGCALSWGCCPFLTTTCPNTDLSVCGPGTGCGTTD